MSTDFNFDVALKGLIELVEQNLKKTCDGFEVNIKNNCSLVHYQHMYIEYNSQFQLEWLENFTTKARKNLNSTTEDVGFKLPKTPARKMTRQQKKRVLNEDDGKYSKPNIKIIWTVFPSIEHNNDNHSTNDVPMKKGKLSHDEGELRGCLGGRPKRQASDVVNWIVLIFILPKF